MTPPLFRGLVASSRGLGRVRIGAPKCGFRRALVYVTAMLQITGLQLMLASQTAGSGLRQRGRRRHADRLSTGFARALPMVARRRLMDKPSSAKPSEEVNAIRSWHRLTSIVAELLSKSGPNLLISWSLDNELRAEWDPESDCLHAPNATRSRASCPRIRTRKSGWTVNY